MSDKLLNFYANVFICGILLSCFALIAVAKRANTITSGDIVIGSKSALVVAPVIAPDIENLKVNVILESSCLTKPIILTDCALDGSGNVKHCASAIVNFRPKCGAIEVIHARK